ncbi:prolipoprotein diacylglyceryl transferase family protein [Geobacter argillaceus]|uniref:Prolipoprotein diacylglyceryl transferase n=1 Tax=Geobacter argillaceus TaxID=345631 RepID=A0A562VG31_9BACT|nr:prolipoprotein diacylglyceryl transferase family protein [Geobacter argillaceus]TWJ16865.1 prolipoprotein diacylglyceryl transferase [Geobacter argillaceus]
MNDMLLVAMLAVCCAGYLWWGVRFLPAERWQIAAAVPLTKDNTGSWRGVNLTWYGILSANAYVVATGIAFGLFAAIGLPARASFAMLFAMLVVCVPASRLVARLVERKANTFTVGGAVFVGTLVAPWVAMAGSSFLRKSLGVEVPAAAIIAAITIGYGFGEGLGRLACLSFGCCYGKPLTAAPPFLARIFGRYSTVFYGATKKAAYAGSLEGVKVLPVQGMTAVIYTVCGLVGIALFGRGMFSASFLLALTVTQGWRVLSEFLRDDYRGGGTISAYQFMAVISVAYGWLLLPILKGPAAALPELAKGAAALWGPTPLLLLELLWVVIFLYTGRSTVTGATMHFHVEEHRI